MKNIARNIIAVVLGLLIGGAVNMALVLLGPKVFPPPAGVDVSDAASLKASIHLLEPRHFVFPFLAHALGTIVGSGLAYILAGSQRPAFGFAIGAIGLAGGIAATQMIPAPTWFVVLDLGVAYLPMAGLGTILGKSLRRKFGEPNP